MTLGAHVKVNRRFGDGTRQYEYGYIVNFFDGIYPVIRFGSGDEETFNPNDVEFVR